MNKKYSLREWQTFSKPKDEIIFNSSPTDGSDNFVNFPIGVQYSYNIDPDTYIKNQVNKHNKTLLCSIAIVTDFKRRGNEKINRNNIVKILKNNNIKNFYSIEDYFNILSEYKFIISPEGNGIDCHRHYEALIHGCIPIVEENELIKNKYKGCPILYTKDYSEINEEYLEKVYLEMIDKIYDFSPLYLSSYNENDKRTIIHNGNFWSIRLLNKLWYK